MTTNPDAGAGVHPETSASDQLEAAVSRFGGQHPWWTCALVLALAGALIAAVAALVLPVLHGFAVGRHDLSTGVHQVHAFVGSVAAYRALTSVAAVAAVLLVASFVAAPFGRPSWWAHRCAATTVGLAVIIPAGLVIRSSLMHSPALIPTPSKAWVEAWYAALPGDRQVFIVAVAAFVLAWAVRRVLVVAWVVACGVLRLCAEAGAVVREVSDWWDRERGYSAPANLSPGLTVVGSPTESPPEEMFWQAYQANKYPDLVGLVAQHQVFRGRYRLDFAVPSKKVAVEIDGLAFHNGQGSFVRDRSRQRKLEQHGWRVIRFAAVEVMKDAERCVRDADAFAKQVAAGKEAG